MSKNLVKLCQQVDQLLKDEAAGKRVYRTQTDGFFKIMDNGKEKPDQHGLSEYFKYEIGLMTNPSFNLYYTGTHYELADQFFIGQLAQKFTQFKATAAQIKGYMEYVKHYCYKDISELAVPNGLINLQNGVLDIHTRLLHPHSPDYFFRYCLNHAYDANAKCPRFLSFLNYIFQEDSQLIQLTQQIFGYCLLGGEPIAHKAFLLFGGGRNGKSTWLKILEKLVGQWNCSYISMGSLDKPFSMIHLDGKLVNISEESPYHINPDSFKNIVSGGTVLASLKYQNEFPLKILTRLFFACNTMPEFNDKTIAIKERLCILPFNRYIEKDEREYTPYDHIVRNEMPGILNFALDGIGVFIANGNKFFETDAGDDALELFKQETDSVYAWCIENLKENESAAPIKLSLLFKIYREDMKEQNTRAVCYRTFTKRLNNFLKDHMQPCIKFHNGVPPYLQGYSSAHPLMSLNVMTNR